MNKKSRRFLVTASVFLTLFFLGNVLPHVNNIAAAADKWPDKAMKLVIPWKPGGGTDRSARVFAPYLAKELGVPVNPVNISGGGGWVAWAQMAKWESPADDYMIGFGNLPHILSLLDPRLKRKETLEDFGWITLHTFDPCIWAVREGDERFQSLKELIAYIKANPGKVTFHVSGVGGDDHLGAAAALKSIPGLKVNFLYSNGDAERIAAVLGKTSDVCGGNVAYYINYALEAKLKPIAILNDKRVKGMPTVPTFEEVTGKKVISYAARCIVGPSNLPSEKKQIILDAVKRAAENPEYAMKAMNMGDVVDLRTGPELKKLLDQAKELAQSVSYWKDAK